MFYPFMLMPLPLGSLLSSYQLSSASGKGIVLLLVVFSIFSWTVMISKFVELYKNEKETKRFISAYRSEKHPVSLFLKKRIFEQTPLYVVYDLACQALGGELGTTTGSGTDPFSRGTRQPENKITVTQLEIVHNLIERNVADQALLLEAHMVFLATSVSVAPLLGLLGTVWGVMDSFGSISITGTATLSAVAPGIAGALLTTVIGLLVAMPSSVAYNLLSNKIRQLTVELDNFSQELYADIQRSFFVE